MLPTFTIEGRLRRLSRPSGVSRGSMQVSGALQCTPSALVVTEMFFLSRQEKYIRIRSPSRSIEMSKQVPRSPPSSGFSGSFLQPPCVP